MGESMSVVSVSPLQRLRVWAALVHQLVGWAGFAGMSLVVAAVFIVGPGWSSQRAFLESVVARMGTAEQAASLAAARAVPVVRATQVAPELPRRADIPLLLTQMQQAARTNGLPWPAADYRIVAATSTQPSSLEVHFTIKGSYPKLRAMLVQLMIDVPAFSIRQFSVSRSNSDTPEVEAKLVLAVFLADDGTTGDVVQPKVPQ